MLINPFKFLYALCAFLCLQSCTTMKEELPPADKICMSSEDSENYPRGTKRKAISLASE